MHLLELLCRRVDTTPSHGPIKGLSAAGGLLACHGRNDLHLYELVRPAEHGHALQRPGRLMWFERRVYDVPRHGEVFARRRGDKHSHEDGVRQLRARRRKSHPHVPHADRGLFGDVAYSDSASISIERARAGEEHESRAPRHNRRGGVRNGGRETCGPKETR
jgi:hypothetical protein